MAAPHEQLDPEAAPAEELSMRLGSPVRTPQERQMEGNIAYVEARERKRVHGLDDETVGLFAKASHDLMAAEIDQLRRYGTADPSIMLRRAASMAWQAEATPYGVFYERPNGHVSVRSNLQELAMKELWAANDILFGRSKPSTSPIDTVSISPGLVAEMAAEAAEESGTARQVSPELLEREGIVSIEQFIGEQAMSGEHGPKFTALVADKEDTGIHNLPLVA